MITREQWLEQATEMLRGGIFKDAEARLPVGSTAIIPPVRVSVGFPGGGSARKRIGECWNGKASDDGIPQVFISPVLSDSVRVLDVLVHEVIHAIVPDAGHKAPFKRIAVAVGLTGKMTATVAGPELEARLKTMVTTLGEYPHAKINLSSRKKQTTRMLKLECKSCGFICRASQKAIDEHGIPTCACGERLNGAEGGGQ